LETGEQFGGTASDLEGPGQQPRTAATALDAGLHGLPDASQTCPGLCVGAPVAFVRPHDIRNGTVMYPALLQEFLAAAKGPGKLIDARQLGGLGGGVGVTLHDKAAAHRVVAALDADLAARVMC